MKSSPTSLIRDIRTSSLEGIRQFLHRRGVLAVGHVLKLGGVRPPRLFTHNSI